MSLIMIYKVVESAEASNYRSESMNNLDWSSVEDEKDKRIRELEDTLRKQKELMEILQRKMALVDDEERPNSLQDCEEPEL